jgi:hypothetical protein
MSRARGGAALLLAFVCSGPSTSRAAGEIGPGAYCPLPKRGETPTCLEPAQAEFGDFFRTVQEGGSDPAGLARVEETVAAGAVSERAFLALSSLSYGYYRLSQQAARTPGADPEIAARLERWNELLGRAYETSGEHEDYRRAVREAALDLQRNAPPVRLTCRDERGEPVACDSTDAVMRGIDTAADDVGLRGGLERLLERILGGDDS